MNRGTLEDKSKAKYSGSSEPEKLVALKGLVNESNLNYGNEELGKRANVSDYTDSLHNLKKNEVDRDKQIIKGDVDKCNKVPNKMQQVPLVSKETLSEHQLGNTSNPLRTLGAASNNLPENLKDNQDELSDLQQYIENYKINAISPISNEVSTLSSPQITLPNGESASKAMEKNTKKSTVDSFGGIPTRPKLNPVLPQPISTFKESTGMARNKKDEASDEFSSSATLDEKKLPSWLKQNKHKVAYGSLGIFILLIISCFIPVVVKLYHGTQATVENYFKSQSQGERLKMLQSLFSEYGLLRNSTTDTRISRKESKGSDLGGFNTINGISPTYKNDSEIISLMTDKELFGTVFYGLGYAPRDAMEPTCGVTKRDILLDLAYISRVTTRIRNYGMQCNQSDFILDSIQDLRLNMTLAMGVWIGSNETTNKQQIAWMKDILRKYPRNLFECIFIGNEVLFREEQTSKSLITYIEDAKSFAKEIGYNDLPIGTSEIGSLIDRTLLESCDIIGANVHPFFSGGEVESASQWAFDFVKYQIEPLNKDFNAEIIITEVGWPYKGGSYEAAEANPKSFQSFINDFVCDAYENDYGWYYFEAYDEPWKKIFYEDGNKWETEWGVFTKTRTKKKNISLPNC